MFKRLFSAGLILGVAALAPPALAQSTCMPRDHLIERLTKSYAEELAGGGLQSQGQLLEVWSSPDSGSFTVFITSPDGLSCVVATGEHWHSTTLEVVAPELKG